MAEPSSDSRSVASLAKALAPAAFMAAVTVLIPFIFWNWGAPYEKPLRLVVLTGLLIPLAITAVIAWRRRDGLRLTILAIDAIALAIIVATMTLVILKT